MIWAYCDIMYNHMMILLYWHCVVSLYDIGIMILLYWDCVVSLYYHYIIPYQNIPYKKDMYVSLRSTSIWVII